MWLRLLALILLVPSFGVGGAAAVDAAPRGDDIVAPVAPHQTALRTIENSVDAGQYRSVVPGVMGAERSGHTSTLLLDGRVLIAGGAADGSLILNFAELYDPATDVFTPTGTMTKPRTGHTATRLEDGRVLIVSGRTSSNSPMSNTAELYDPASGTFTTTGSLQGTVNSIGALLLRDGRVFVLTSASQPQIYDPATGTFSLVRSGSSVTAGATPAAVPTQDSNLFELPNGDIQTAFSDGISIYDLDTGTQEKVVSFKHGYHGITTVFPDGRVLAAGSIEYYEPSQRAEIYDPATRTVTDTGSLNEIRFGASSTMLADGRVLISGGYEPYDKYGIYHLSAEIYDPATGQFTLTGNMRYSTRRAFQSTLLLDGTVLLTGGAEGNARYTTETAERFDPITATFLPIQRLQGGGVPIPLDDGSALLVRAGAPGTTVPSARYFPATVTVSPTGSLVEQRGSFALSKLSDGRVLVIGGYNASGYVASAELYDPVSGAFTTTGSLREARANATATLLPNGKVLVAGGNNARGSLATMELYDPATRSFQPTATMSVPRTGHTATVLPTGRVLLIGGQNGSTYQTSVDLYDIGKATITPTAPFPRRIANHTATRLPDGNVLVVGGDPTMYSLFARYLTNDGTFTPLASFGEGRTEHSANRLQNGKVLVAGGFSLRTNGTGGIVRGSVLAYEPTTDEWSSAGFLRYARGGHTTVRLENGQLLVMGGRNNNYQIPVYNEIGWFDITNRFSASATLPGGWLTQTSTLTVTGRTTQAPLAGIAVNNNRYTDATAGQPVVLPITLPQGKGQRLAIRLRDTTGVMSTVIVTTADVDTVAPRAAFSNVPPFTQGTIPLTWRGTDATSGVASYDVEARDTSTDTWTPILSATTRTSTTFRGTPGKRYEFRVRARDAAGNVGAWTSNVFSEVDTVAPVGNFRINDGALSTTVVDVILTLTPTDTQSSITRMRLRVAGTLRQWQPFANTIDVELPSPDGIKDIQVEFEDQAGNQSASVSQSIRRDLAAGTVYRVSINDAAAWTNSLNVTLTVGAPAGTSRMMISNDGGFPGAAWQPFDTRPVWRLAPEGASGSQRTVFVSIPDTSGQPRQYVFDTILYDPVAPLGSLAVTGSTETTVTVQTTATDDASGLARMRVGTDPKFGGVAWQPYSTSATVVRDGRALGDLRLYAQWEDVAGNTSLIRCVTGTGQDCGVVFPYRVALPLVQR